MAHAVVIYFNDVSVKPILDIWAELKREKITENLQPDGIRPHITLAVFNTLNCLACQEEIAQLAHGSGITNIKANHLGLFPQSPPVIFLAPAAHGALIEFQIKIHQVLQDYVEGSWDIYHPENWVPHCTIVRDIKKKNLHKALDICSQLALPIELITSQVGIVSFDPVESIFSVDLK